MLIHLIYAIALLIVALASGYYCWSKFSVWKLNRRLKKEILYPEAIAEIVGTIKQKNTSRRLIMFVMSISAAGCLYLARVMPS